MRTNTLFLKGVCLVTAITVLLGATSCGTILYPERRGQPAGHIDAGVAIMDAIGLLFFIVPGVIAFAVDFSTGAIYLPPEHELAEIDSSSINSAEKVQLDQACLTRQGIETVITEKTGRSVNLTSDNVKVARALADQELAWNSIGQVLSTNQLAVFDCQVIR